MATDDKINILKRELEQCNEGSAVGRGVEALIFLQEVEYMRDGMVSQDQLEQVLRIVYNEGMSHMMTKVELERIKGSESGQ